MTANAKISGAWEEVSDIQAKVSGTWKTVDEGYSKISGVWKQFYSAVAPFTSAYELLETVELTSSTSSVSFTGLGSYTDYKHLQIRAVAQSDRSSTSGDTLGIHFNADTSASYTRHMLGGNGSSLFTLASTGRTSIDASGIISASADNSNTYGGFIADILDFQNTSKNTTAKILGGYADANTDVSITSGLYINQAAITEITLDLFAGDNFTAGSRFSLYGIKDS